MINIGLQTYTVKKIIRNKAEIERTFSELSVMGIKCIELAIDYLKMPYNEETARIIRAAADDKGIQIISCQIRYNTVMLDYDKTVRIFNILGAKYLTNSTIDVKLMLKGKSGILKFCSNLNELSDKLKKDNIILGHHNHHFEFLKYENRSVLDIMAEYYKGQFVLDTYWVQRGGANHLVLLEKLKGRVDILHLRDYKIKFSKFDLLGTDTEAGNGNLPFAEILLKAEQTGVKYGMIEQSTKTPLDSVKISYNHLINL